MTGWRFRVHARPAGQGSMRRVGRAVLHDSPRLAVWRRAVTVTARAAGVRAGLPGAAYAVWLVFFLPQLPGTSLTRHRDLDKLSRGVFDALSKGCPWQDDGQVVDLHAVKRHADAQHPPGVAVTILEVDGAALSPPE